MKTKFPQELSDLLDSATTSCKILPTFDKDKEGDLSISICFKSCKILPTFDKDKEGDLSVSICFKEITVILNDNGTWHYSKPTNS
jgi:hypothetical protein